MIDYDYFLPEGIIAQKPSTPRDSCKLLVYDTKTDKVFVDLFYNLTSFLSKDYFLVLNNTKVVPSRIILYKPTGGKVEALFLVNEIEEENIVKIMSDRKINIHDKLSIEKENHEVYFDVVKQEEKYFFLKFNFSKEKLFSLLKEKGTMPIPPYIKNTPLSEDQLRDQYQTIFALKEGSAAAPTASLHFTDRGFNDLKAKNINKYYITLNVGLGTFSPIDESNINSKKLHKEFFEIDEKNINKINEEKKNGKKLIAVGTTTVRTLESAIENDGNIKRGVSSTEIFIYPPYEFKIIDGLLTNFHLPKSSLIMLVDAFLQFKKSKKNVLDLYKIAIENDFKFFSFGDAMLII